MGRRADRDRGLEIFLGESPRPSSGGMPPAPGSTSGLAATRTIPLLSRASRSSCTACRRKMPSSSGLTWRASAAARTSSSTSSSRSSRRSSIDRPSRSGRGPAPSTSAGWRIIDDEGNPVALRAAYIVDDDGREIEVRVPEYTTSAGKRGRVPARLTPFAALGKLDDLAKVRDQNLERVQYARCPFAGRSGGMPEAWLAPPRPTPTAPPASRWQTGCADTATGARTAGCGPSSRCGTRRACRTMPRSRDAFGVGRA